MNEQLRERIEAIQTLDYYDDPGSNDFNVDRYREDVIRAAQDQARDTGGLRAAAQAYRNHTTAANGRALDAALAEARDTGGLLTPEQELFLAETFDSRWMTRPIEECRAGLRRLLSQGAAHEERGLDAKPLTGDVPAGTLEYDARSGEYTLTERLGPDEYGVAFLLFRLATPEAAPDTGREP